MTAVKTIASMSTIFEQIATFGYNPFLEVLNEPGANSLRIVVAEGIAGEPLDEVSVLSMPVELRAISLGARPKEVGRSCLCDSRDRSSRGAKSYAKGPRQSGNAERRPRSTAFGATCLLVGFRELTMDSTDSIPSWAIGLGVSVRRPIPRLRRPDGLRWWLRSDARPTGNRTVCSPDS
jgi:hypothetical protein